MTWFDDLTYRCHDCKTFARVIDFGYADKEMTLEVDDE